MKAKQRTLLVLVALAALAAAALWWLTAQNEAAEQAESAAEAGTIPLSRVTADTLSQIVIDYGGETLTIDYADGAWTLAEDPEYHLDTTTCNTMLTNLSELNAKRELTQQAGEDYGLDAPQATVTVTADGETRTIIFGAENTVTGDLYVQTSDSDAVYTVDSAKLGSFEVTKADLFGAFQPAGLTSSDIEGIEYTLADGETVALTARSEPAADSTEDAESSSYETVWRLASDPEAELDETAVDDLVAAVSSYVAGQITDADPAAYGFAKPLAVYRITTADGTVTMRYASGTGGYYMMVDGDDSVYSIDTQTIAALLHTASDYLADDTAA